MADAPTLGAAYSSAQGRARPLPSEHAPAFLKAALFLYTRAARPSHCVLEALRETSGGATITTPGGAGTSLEHCNFLRARRIGFGHGERRRKARKKVAG